MSLNTTHTNWITGSYATDVVYLLKIAENNSLRLGTSMTGLQPTLDSVNSLVIGYGYDLVKNKATAFADLVAAGATITNAAQLQTALNSLTEPVSVATKTLIANLVSLPNEAAATTLLQNAIAVREASFDSFLSDTQINVSLPHSNERTALMSLWYQGQSAYFGTVAHPTNLTNALIDGNRAEAWFQIRYGSAANGGGVIPRRYIDSQLFGLYDNPSQPSYSDALQAYQVLTENRSTIISYEQRNGADPDGTDPSTPINQIDAANDTYMPNQDFVQTLSQIYDPAEDSLIASLRASYSLLTNLTDDFARSTDIFVAPSQADIDAGFATAAQLDVKPGVDEGSSASDLTEADRNHIILGSGDGDTLNGGLGHDILIAGSGNETLRAGVGTDTLIGGDFGLGNDTIVSRGLGNVIDFEFGATASGLKETVVENAAGLDSLYINGTQIGSGLTRQAGTANIWTSTDGTQYRFVPNPSNAPTDYTGMRDPSVGELQITGGSVGGNEVDIWGFNLQTAENNVSGFDGIHLQGGVTIVGGATGTNPTILVDAPSDVARAVTVTLTGTDSSTIEAIIDGVLTPINSNGTFNVALAAGETSVSFGLIVTNGVSGVDTVTMTASLSDPSNPNGSPMVSAPLTESFTVPAANPPPQLTALDGQYNANTGVTTYSDPHNDYNDSVVASGAHNDIVGSMDGNNLLLGGSGADTIFAGEGVTTIAGGGGQDVILGYGPDHPGTYQIYEQTQTDVATAIAQGAAPTGSSGRGDVIAVGNGDNTIVGASGNDLILAADGNDVVVMGTGNSLFLGGVEINDTDVATLTNWSWNADPTIGFVFENISFEPYGDYQSSGVQPYNGNWVIGSTLPLGYGNDTIFAGSGNQVVLLTNGNNYVDAGSGNDTISAGMGNNTIVGGSGDDYIRGGGGNTYISAVSGNNTLTGGVGNNTILGGSGNDFISSGPYGQILTQPDGSTVPVNNFPGQTFAVHITPCNELSMAA